jgi:DNA-binding Lrp family transcriptional regulator
MKLSRFEPVERIIVLREEPFSRLPKKMFRGIAMAKTSRKQMDKDEKKVMAELEKDSNESLDALAKRLKFSRQKTWRIIRRLERNRTIWGYTAIVDDESRSLKGYVLMLKRSSKPMDEKTMDTFVSESLQELASGIGVSLENIYFVQGEYDWILTFAAPDIMQAKKFCETLLTSYPGVFMQMSLVETLVTVRKHHIANPNATKLKDFL